MGKRGPNYVYILWRSDEAHKIGHSANPEARLQQIRVMTNLDVLLVHKVRRPWGDACSVENFAHGVLAASRLRGEWFQVSEAAAIRVVAHACQVFDNSYLRAAKRKKIDVIEARLGRQLSRIEIITRELAGEFGQVWADVRRRQGWDRRLQIQ